MTEDKVVTEDVTEEAAEETVAEKPEGDAREQLESLRPSGEPVSRKVGVGDEEREYVQKPLSFFGKMDFYALVGESIDTAMSGPDGLSIDAVLGSVEPVAGRALTAADLMAADSLMATIAKLAKYTPDLLLSCYTIWLNVPLEERPWFRATVIRPVDEGGFSDEEGIDILKVFIEQNAEAIEAFFTKHLPLVSKTFSNRRQGGSR